MAYTKVLMSCLGIADLCNLISRYIPDPFLALFEKPYHEKLLRHVLLSLKKPKIQILARAAQVPVKSLFEKGTHAEKFWFFLHDIVQKGNFFDLLGIQNGHQKQRNLMQCMQTCHLFHEKLILYDRLYHSHKILSGNSISISLALVEMIKFRNCLTIFDFSDNMI